MFNVIILGLTSFFTDVASEMVYPLIPFFLTSVLGASPAVLGLIEGAAESVASLLKVFSGYISDKLKKRKSLAITGYASSAVGKLLLYVANSWGFVFAGRVVDRLGKGIRTAPRDALIADSVDPAKKGTAFGLHRAMDTTGAAIGVVLAYFFLTHYAGEYSKVFLWSLVPAAIGILLLFLAREKKAEIAARKAPSLKWKILPRTLQLFLIVAFIFTLGNSSNTFLLLRSKDILLRNALYHTLAHRHPAEPTLYPFIDRIIRKYSDICREKGNLIGEHQDDDLYRDRLSLLFSLKGDMKNGRVKRQSDSSQPSPARRDGARLRGCDDTRRAQAFQLQRKLARPLLSPGGLHARLHY